MITEIRADVTPEQAKMLGKKLLLASKKSDTVRIEINPTKIRIYAGKKVPAPIDFIKYKEL